MSNINAICKDASIHECYHCHDNCVKEDMQDLYSDNEGDFVYVCEPCTDSLAKVYNPHGCQA